MLLEAKHNHALRLAREYVADFDIAAAADRADMSIEEAEKALKTKTFNRVLRELMELLPPETVVTRTEILMALKKEMYSKSADANASTRISAAKELARLAGFEPENGKSGGGGSPVINITFNGSTHAQLKPALPAE
jgi:hypothetical protein